MFPELECSKKNVTEFSFKKEDACAERHNTYIIILYYIICVFHTALVELDHGFGCSPVTLPLQKGGVVETGSSRNVIPDDMPILG